MKQILLLVISFLSLNSCDNKDKHISLEEESKIKIISVSRKKIPRFQKNYKTINLQGKVKSIVCTNYQQFVTNSELSNYITKVNYKFDQIGNAIEEITFLAPGEIFHYQYYYDDMGNRIKSVKLDENSKKVVAIATSLLDEQGLELNNKSMELTKTKDYKDTIRTIETIMKYKIITDTLLDYTFYEKSRPKDYIRNIDYYKNGNLIKQINYSYGRAWVLSTYQYDEQNNKIMWTESDPDSGSASRIWHFKYDKNNRQINWQVDSFENNFKREIKKSYDDYGNITEEIQIENGKINEKISFKSVYIYDKQNNWIKQTRYKLNGDKISVLDRKITYY